MIVIRGYGMITLRRGKEGITEASLLRDADGGHVMMMKRQAGRMACWRWVVRLGWKPAPPVRDGTLSAYLSPAPTAPPTARSWGRDETLLPEMRVPFHHQYQSPIPLVVIIITRYPFVTSKNSMPSQPQDTRAASHRQRAWLLGTLESLPPLLARLSPPHSQQLFCTLQAVIIKLRNPSPNSPVRSAVPLSPTLADVEMR